MSAREDQEMLLRELRAKRSELADLEKRLKAQEAMWRGEAPMPALWAKKARIGLNSINIAGDTLTFGDAAAAPSAAGDMQRDGSALKYKKDGSTVDTLTNGFWNELGRTTLGSAADSIAVNSFANRNFLLVIIHVIPSGSVSERLRFNSDSGTNYSYRLNANGGTDSTSTSDTAIDLLSTASNTDRFRYLFIVNRSASDKMVIGFGIESTGTGTSNTPDRNEVVGFYDNTASAITSLSLTNTGAGDFASGTEVIVLGGSA